MCTNYKFHFLSIYVLSLCSSYYFFIIYSFYILISASPSSQPLPIAPPLIAPHLIFSKKGETHPLTAHILLEGLVVSIITYCLCEVRLLNIFSYIMSISYYFNSWWCLQQFPTLLSLTFTGFISSELQVPNNSILSFKQQCQVDTQHGRALLGYIHSLQLWHLKNNIPFCSLWLPGIFN